MRDEWIEIRNRKYEEEISSIKDDIKQKILNTNFFVKAYKENLIHNLYEIATYKEADDFENDLHWLWNKEINKKTTSFWEYHKWYQSIPFTKLASKVHDKNIYDSMIKNSDIKEFDGDIIITDPCYILSDKDWHLYDYNNLEELGFTNYMSRGTIYGDWSCTVYNTDTKEKIGKFCADAGLVGVYLLKEIHNYNPQYDDYINHPYAATLIKDFKGTVQFVVKYEHGFYKEDTEFHKKGELWEDYSLQVVGHGIDKKSGKPINFVGKQTGF